MRRRDWVQIFKMFEGSWVQFDGRSSFRGDGNRLIRVRFVIRSQSAASSRRRSRSVGQRSHKVHEINEMSSNAQLREHTKDSHHAAFPAVPASFRRTARPRRGFVLSASRMAIAASLAQKTIEVRLGSLKRKASSLSARLRRGQVFVHSGLCSACARLM